MRLRQHPEASAELREALDYYEAKGPELAVALYEEVAVTHTLIRQNPLRWRRISAQAKSFTLDRYPYSVIYTVLEDEIVIVAYAHHKRRPGYWRDRLQNSH